MKTPPPELSRRDFLAAATTTAATLALGLGAEKGGQARLPVPPRLVGISDDAYARARTRAQGLVAQMTLAEKITQTGAGVAAVPRLSLPAYNFYANEALHGLCSGPQVTSFPVPLALAAAWNPALARQVYGVVGDECRAHGIFSLYSPATLNLHRDPRWGRCYEAPGEDPCLAATLAVQIVRGMQGDSPNALKTTACSKHFICNNTDNDRDSVSATVDPRSFWEFYTRAYRATIVHGDVFTFMSAYNATNGVPCSADHALLTDLLRTRWGFRGFVNSDCDAVADIFNPHHYAKTPAEAAAMAIKAGCEVNCGGTLQGNLQAAVDQGLVSEAEIAEAVTRSLTVRVLLGNLDPPEASPYRALTLTTLPWAAHDALALEAARQSLVLLKNDADFLPLDPRRVHKLAVIGPLGDQCHLGGYSGSPAIQISPVKGLAARLGVAVHSDTLATDSFVASHGGVTLQGSPVGTQQLAYISDGDWVRYNAVDLTGKTELRAKVASAGAGGRIEVRLDKLDGPLAATLTVPGTGSWDKLVDVSAPLVNAAGRHDVWLVFRGGGGYILNVERLTPLPLSAPETWREGGGRQVLFRGGCGVTGARDDAAFADAVSVAKGADVVVLVCGVNGDVDGEGHDRDTIALTGAQHDLIQAVHAVNPKTVLVLSSNNSVAVGWEQDNLPAILAAICAGQRQGTAIAEALFGDANPGGKLPCTWYRSLDQLPPAHDYDIHNGRTYQYFEGDPLYPFGFGLSYTRFRLDRLKASGPTLAPGGAVRFSVRVSNTGKRAGAEVVQLYVAPPPGPVKRPRRQLAGFQRVVLKPGEQRTVEFEIAHTAQPFWHWDEAQKSFVCPPGTATVEVGTSSAGPFLSAPLSLGLAAPLPQPDAVETVAAPCAVS